MRFLTKQPDHHICVREESNLLYFFAQLHCPEDIGMDMLNLMSKTGKIDHKLWTEQRVIVSADLLNSLEGAYKNRHNKIISIDEIMVSYHNNPITYPNNTAHAGLCLEIEGLNPQRILKETKLKESIGDGVSYQPVDNSSPQPPKPDEDQKGASEEELKKRKPEPVPDVDEGDLQSLVAKIKTKHPKFPVETWYGKNRSAHPEAIIHVLKSLLKAENVGNETAYIQKALDVENGKYNAKDHAEKTKEIERELSISLDQGVKGLVLGIG
jgi:hypothetical protein